LGCPNLVKGPVQLKKLGGEKEDSARRIRPYSYLTEVKPAGNQSENSKPPCCNHASHFISTMDKCPDCEKPSEQTVILTPKQIIEILDNEKMDCNKCDYYGECDHQGAYQKDGKWCYE